MSAGGCLRHHPIPVLACFLDEFAKAMREGLAMDGPTVIEVPVAPTDDVFPFLPPGKGIKETVYGSSKEMAVF